MHFRSVSTSEKRNKVMTPDQFRQVVEAITEGRYSWACVLILRFAGYNPVHFIPYRTYNRLMKENRLLDTADLKPVNQVQPRQPTATAKSDSSTASEYLVEINELSYLETIDPQENALEGGNLPPWFDEVMKERDLFKTRIFGNQQSNYAGWRWLKKAQ